MTFQQITHADDLAQNLQLLQRMLAGETERYEVEKRVRRKNGEYIWYAPAPHCSAGTAANRNT